MGELEFIIALTEHRNLGMVFQPLLIERKERYFTVVRLVKPRDFKDADYSFSTWEKELVTLIDRYSDEKLMRKFSRAGNVSEFYKSLNQPAFEKNIQPFLEQQMMQVASLLMVSPVRLFKKDAKYSNLYEEDFISVNPFFGQPRFYFERTETETRYKLRIFLKEKELKISNATMKVVTTKPLLLLHRNQLIVFERLSAKKLSPFFEKDWVVVPNTIQDKYYSGFILNTVRDFEVEATGFSVRNAEIKPNAVLSLEKNLQYEPVFVLQFEYGKERFLPGAKRKIAVSMQAEKSSFVFLKTIRDFEWEENIAGILCTLGLSEINGNYTIKGLSVLTTESALFELINWLNRNKKELASAGFKIIQDKLEKNYFTGEQKLFFETKVKGDWFDVYAVVHFGEYEVPFVKLKKYILNGIREFVLPNGQTAILPEEWFTRFKDLLPFAKNTGEALRLGKHHFTLLQNNPGGRNRQLSEKMDELRNKTVGEVALPENLKASLRSYQTDGFRWMYHLQKNGFGGCLADDMGLGKTVQTLTLLLKLKREKKAVKIMDPFSKHGQLSMFDSETDQEEIQKASLIVLPTSLVHNWDNEIRKFTPSLKAYKYVGVQRKKSADISQIASYYDIILTTYGTVRNDRKLLSAIEFFYVILDESQAVKNPLSKTYRAVMDLKARHRLVMTGTPIENSLSDLWSQMNFLNEGILGNLSYFRKAFLVPIEKNADEERQEKLRMLIHPFVLRRKKEEVARDLPPLMEQVVFCEMAKDQAKIYEQEKSLIRNAILENIEREGMEKSAMVILRGLTKLRQLANHPQMLGLETEDGSGKFDEIFRMLESVVAEKHKVLIFSTFVKHLDLLKKRINEEKWKFSILTGQTTNREEVISGFQNDPKNQIFLISLKAGGVGLNLTQADYVFIIDPWWNPAAENQAINRAHRIGQDKNVFVYRFITEKTIEEKIQLLKEQKSELADKFINSNNPFQKISKEEIVQLFN